MKRLWKLGVTTGALLAFAQIASAADHRDGAAVKTDPATDINDVYAWMSPDASKVYLAMTVFPLADANAKFSNAAKYSFHLTSKAGYAANTSQAVDLTCTFDADQKVKCWVVKGATVVDYVTGDPSATTGLVSTSGKVKVFAGLRDDPFFFNLDGFLAVATTVAGAAGGLQFDTHGCPALDEATSNALVGQLSTKPGGGAAENFFAGKNTLAIVIAIDKTLVTPGGEILGVWASTNR